MSTNINFVEWIALALVLLVVHRVGRIQGADAQFKASDQVVRRLQLSLLEAQEEAAQCRFACELFKAALEQRTAQEEQPKRTPR